MNRPIVYPGQVPFSSDLLGASRDAMIGLSKLAAAVLGSNTIVNGLACSAVPNTLAVSVGPGEIYQLAAIDANPYGSLLADTAHQILKQGIALDAVQLACPAPASAGSVAYLVQATFQEVDTDYSVLPFYNTSNPSQAFMGLGNNGAALPTHRKGLCVVSAKPSQTAAAPTAPAPDQGCVGLWVVTVAFGQTAITAANITSYSPSPILLETLPQKISLATGDGRYATIAAAAAAQATANSAVTAAATAQASANNAQASANTGIANAAAAQASAYNAAPTGAITFFPYGWFPAGWLPANGAPVSRTTYVNLFNVIGTYYGAGDGTSTFNLPDLRGEFIRAWDAGRGVDAGRAIGTWQAATGIDNQVYQTVVLFYDNADNNGVLDTPVLYWDSPGYAGVNRVHQRLRMRPRNVALYACIKY